MYICLSCKKEFQSEEKMSKHIMKCWKELHPFHRSSEAPHSEDLNTRTDNEDILKFFESFN